MLQQKIERLLLKLKREFVKQMLEFTQLSPIWKYKGVSKENKLRLFQDNVQSIRLGNTGGDSHTTNRLQVFVNRCFIRLLRVFRPNVIPNEDLQKLAQEEPIEIYKKKKIEMDRPYIKKRSKSHRERSMS